MWDELDQDTYPDLTDTFVCRFDAPNLGDDETGVGAGLSGVNLVLTEANNVPGAAGSPVYRQITAASSQDFTFTQTLAEIVCGRPQYQTMIKCEDYSTVSSTIIDLSGATDELQIYKNGADKTLAFYVIKDGVAETVFTATAIPDAGVVWISIRWDGTTLQAGFKAGTRPKSWSDFSIVNSTKSGAFDPGDFGSGGFLGRRQAGPPFQYVTAKLYYLMIGKEIIL